MPRLSTMTAGLVAATGLIAATITPASAADNGAGWATVRYNPDTRMCQLDVAPGSRAEAQLKELRRIYIAHFTGANKDMRNKVAADLGLTADQINRRQYSNADAKKIGMTKAQLQALHDQLNRKGAVEFLIATGVSYYGVPDVQRTTNEQVKFLKYDRENGLGRGVYWVTNDAGRVDYVPPQPVKDYFQRRLLGTYKQVLIDKQRGAELSNYATQMCNKSRHNGNKSYGVPIGLLKEIHKYNPGWVNPPTLQMKAADKDDDDNGLIPCGDGCWIIIPGKANNPASKSTIALDSVGSAALKKQEIEVAPAANRDVLIENKMRISNSTNGFKMIPMSLKGEDYIGDPNAHIGADGRVTYISDNSGTGGDHADGDSGSSGLAGLFGSS